LKRQPIIGVIGGNNIDDNTRETAVELGKVIAKSKAVLICGGLDGVMEAACEGAKSEKGTTIGVLPGTEHRSANEFVDIPIVTSLYEERKKIIARTADVAIVLEDSDDSQSEIASALKVGTPVVSLSKSTSKEIENLDDNLFINAESPEEAVATAMNIFNVLGDIKPKKE
jgi:uncharacterized protein (TIGR00725 family)